MIYCVADIHGEIDKFRAMLEKIEFSDEDTLYVLGDAIDRGRFGIEILLDIMERSNVQMILGNHEYMCLATLGPNPQIGARRMWQENGGGPTWQALVYGDAKRYRSKILQFIQELPDYLDIMVEGRKFHLVHGTAASTKHDRIWGRPDPDSESPFPDATVIVGHTPTAFMYDSKDEPLQIWHGDGIIDIDCGCGSQSTRRRLGCLRLNDMKEFYV